MVSLSIAARIVISEDYVRADILGADLYEIFIVIGEFFEGKGAAGVTRLLGVSWTGKDEVLKRGKVELELE